MPAPPDIPDEDRFAFLLADYDDQRRQGNSTPVLDRGKEEYGPRFEQACYVLSLLDAVWPGTDASSVSRQGEATPVAPRAGEALPQWVGKSLGRYHILESLGAGGMGMVFKARHEHLNRLVALKIMRSGLAQDRSQVERFVREMKAAGTVDHPNVIRATDAGEEDGVLFLVMEFVEGETLDQLLRRRGPIEQGPLCEMLRQSALGLHAIAEHGLVHRDIKPSNIMITTRGVVKILDLGLARFHEPAAGDGFGELTPSDVVLGTFDYQAPEQADHARKVDVRADLYSLGCTWFKLATGQPPYAGARMPIQKISAHALQPMPSLPEGAPAELQAIFARLTAKDPADRYATALEAARALEFWCPHVNLETWLGSSQVSSHISAKMQGTPTPILSPPTTATASRRPSWVFSFFGLFILAAVGLAGGMLYWQLPHPQDSTPTDVTSGPKNNAVRPLTPDPPPEPTEPRVVDHFPLLQWHNLLDRKPFPVVFTTSEGLSSWHYDFQAQTLLVHSERWTLLSLGAVKHPHFTLQLGLRMTSWNPGAGLFLGYRAPELQEKTGKVEGTFQTLSLNRTTDSQGKPTLAVARGRVRRTIEAGNKNRFHSSTVAEAPIPDPGNELILEIKVVHGKMEHVKVGDNILPPLTRAEIYRDFDTPEHLGIFGTLNVANTSTFRNIRLMLHDEQ